MNTKAKGSRQERKAKEMLERVGCVVTKSGGSSGAFDLIAESPLGIRHVQVKSNRGRLSGSPLDIIADTAAKVEMDALVTEREGILGGQRAMSESRIEKMKADAARKRGRTRPIGTLFSGLGQTAYAGKVLDVW